MQKLNTAIIVVFSTFLLPACSVFGDSGVEEAPFKMLIDEAPYNVRTYSKLVLVSTPMNTIENRSSAFSRLFNYISGNNENQQKIAMTAPVLMKQDSQIMSFVMPAHYSLNETPLPIIPLIKIESLTDYTVATIRFNGRLSKENIHAHRIKLENWIAVKSYQSIGPAKAAGYNGPFTVPALRRNEILIPIVNPNYADDSLVEL